MSFPRGFHSISNIWRLLCPFHLQAFSFVLSFYFNTLCQKFYLILRYIFFLYCFCHYLNYLNLYFQESFFLFVSQSCRTILVCYVCMCIHQGSNNYNSLSPQFGLNPDFFFIFYFFGVTVLFEVRCMIFFFKNKKNDKTLEKYCFIIAK